MPRKKAASKKAPPKSPLKSPPKSLTARKPKPLSKLLRDPRVHGVDPIDQLENEGGPQYADDDPWAASPTESDWEDMIEPDDEARGLVRGDLDAALDELEEDLACEIEELECFISDRLERIKDICGRI